MKICIIGGGIIGLAVARQFRLERPGDAVVLLEKEARFGAHQSTRNSGVLHAGLHYSPGSEKARLAVAGIRRMVAFCREHSVAHEICGKLVVAVDEGEVQRLRILAERGRRNGLSGLEWLEGPRLREIEPHVAGLAALRVPQEGIVDYGAVCDALAVEARRLGAELRPGSKVLGLRREQGGWIVESGAGELRADYIVNCAGLYCDRIAAWAGERRESRIVPFRGEYYRLRKDRTHLVRHLVYPVPDPKFPFLGVHFTRLIHSGVEAGPNAVLAGSREGYRKRDIHLLDLADVLTFPGLWRFVRRHPQMCWTELLQSFSRRRFCRALQRLVPEIRESDLEPGAAGVRAQAMDPRGELVQDFILIARPDALHLLNAPSPAATASLAIAERIVATANQVAATD